MALNSAFTVAAFSGVLWSISPLLFIVTVLYAACGSYLTITFGRPLIALNSHQLDREASFRAGLIHVRENAEPIMLGRFEGWQAARLLTQLEALVANFRQITAVNLKVGFFTTGYNWLIQIIPALVVAPAFIDRTVEFGVITQSAMAFSTLVAAFSLIVTQFQSLSNFAAVVGRLGTLMESMETSRTAVGSAAQIVDADRRLAYERLTLLSPATGAPLLKELSISIPYGTNALIKGSNQAAATALFKATAGCSIAGTGVIDRPGANGILFLPQRPYLPEGALRQLLDGSAPGDEAADGRLLEILRELDLEQVLAQAGRLDTEQEWRTLCSLREQQLLALARVLLIAPQFVFMDRLDAALGPDEIKKILHLLSDRSISYLSLGEAGDSADLYDAVLECIDDGAWTWSTRETGRAAPS